MNNPSPSSEPGAPSAIAAARRPRRAPALLAAATLLGFAVWKLLPLALGPGVALLEAERRDLTRSLVAGGRIGQSARLPLLAQVGGRVARLPFSEGDHVQAGELVAEIDAPQDQAILAQARATYQEAQNVLQQMQQGQALAAPVQQAVSNPQLQQAQREVERNRELLDKGFVSEAALANAERRLQALQPPPPPLVPNTSLPMLNLAPGAAAGDMEAAMAAVERARAAFESAQQRAESNVVRAPASGTVVKLSVERGTPVQAGQELLVIEPEGAIDIELRVNAQALRLLRVGQPGVATVDLDEPQRFETHVAWIDTAIDTEQGTAVRLAVPAPPEGVRGGLAVQVRIELERRQNTVVIPDTALRDADSRPWVLVVVDGVAERREVRPGLQGDDGIEIIEGVDAGEMLVSTSSPNIRPGDKVRAQ